MGNRLTKIYTRTGDQGTTGLADGSRVEKDSVRVAAIGDVDELNSAIGVVLAHDMKDSMRALLTNIQHTLFDLGGALSLPSQPSISDADVKRLEQTLDALNDPLPPLQEFILPGGGQAAAACHLARAICRRAERSVVALARKESVGDSVRQYLNRLSDLLFVICRVLARESGHGEVLWRARSKGNERS